MVKIFFCVVVEYAHIDLASQKSIRQFVAWFINKNIPLHILVNNGKLNIVFLKIQQNIYYVM